MTKQRLFGQTVVDANGVRRLVNVESNGDGTGRARLPDGWVKVERNLLDWRVIQEGSKRLKRF
jgi:hypothetical protein